jgi:hypothetical protein
VLKLLSIMPWRGMGWRYSSTILHVGTRWRWMVSFTLWPFYFGGKGPRYPLDRRFGGPQNRSGRYETPLPESVNELYQPSDRRLSAKLVPSFTDRGCHVVSVAGPYGRILRFLDRSRGSVVVKALCNKQEESGFDTRWSEFLNLPNSSGRTTPWGLLSL